MNRHRLLAAALVLGVAVAAVPAAAQKKAPPPRKTPVITSLADDARHYDQCMKRVQQSPEDGFEDALQWRDLGGGAAAQHCVAVAMLKLGRPGEAAERLEQLALAMRFQPAALRARVLGQAGQAWLEAGDFVRANAVLSSAIDLNPGDPDLFVDRSEALAIAKNYWEAIDDLNRAIDISPRNAEAFAFRAAAYRFVDSIDLALEDANRAVTLDPTLPEGFLERGIIFRLQNKLPQARADWLQVLVLDGDGPTGDAARANIERLELKLDEPPANRPSPARK